MSKDSLSFTRKTSGEPISGFLRILVPPQTLVLLAISVKRWGGIAHAQQINFQDHIHKMDFDNYYPVTTANFPQMQPQNQYICVGT